MRGTTELYRLDLFVHRNSKHRKRANYRYKSGIEPSQSPDKSNRLLFGLQVDTKRRKCFALKWQREKQLKLYGNLVNVLIISLNTEFESI